MKHKKSKAFLSLLLMGSVIVNVQGTYPVLADGNDLETGTPVVTESVNGNQNLGSVETENEETLGTPQEGTPPTVTVETTDSVGDTVSGGDKNSEGGTTTDDSITIDDETNPDGDTDSEPSEDETVTDEEQKNISEFESSTADGKTTVSVKIENGGLPEGTTLKLEPVTETERAYTVIKDKLDTSDKGAAFAAYKFSFVKDGEPVQTQEDATYKVTIKSASKINNQEVTKLVELQANGTLETVVTTTDQKLSISGNQVVATYTTDKLETVAFIGKQSVGYFSSSVYAATSKTIDVMVFPGDSWTTPNSVLGEIFTETGKKVGTTTVEVSGSATIDNLKSHVYHLEGATGFDERVYSALPAGYDIAIPGSLDPITVDGQEYIYSPDENISSDKYFYTTIWKTVGRWNLSSISLRGQYVLHGPNIGTLNYWITMPNGSIECITKTGKVGSEVKLLDVNDKDTKIDNYSLDGWYSDSSFRNKVTVSKMNLDGTINLYARYIPINYASLTINNKIESYIPEDSAKKIKYSVKLSGFSKSVLDSNGDIDTNALNCVAAEGVVTGIEALDNGKSVKLSIELSNNQSIQVRVNSDNAGNTFTYHIENQADSYFTVTNSTNNGSSIVDSQITSSNKNPVINFINKREMPVPAGIKDGKSSIFQTMVAGAAGLGAFIFLEKAKKHKKKLD